MLPPASDSVVLVHCVVKNCCLQHQASAISLQRAAAPIAGSCCYVFACEVRLWGCEGAFHWGLRARQDLLASPACKEAEELSWEEAALW